MWKDEFLTWDPKLFNGTDYIKVPASKVWLPDIVVESSSLEPEYIMSQDDRVVLITSDGTVYVSFPFVLTNYSLSLAGLYSPFNNAGEREEKVTLGLTTLLTLAVILTMVTGEMPRGSELPVMGLFVLLEIIMIVVSMAISVLTMFLHQRATTRSCSVPHWLTSILFCHAKATGKVADGQQAAFDKTRHDSLTLDVPFYSSSQATSHQAFLLRACLRQLNGTYAKVDGWLNKNEEEEQRKHDWQLVFDWLDSSFFLIFQLVHLIAFILMFYPYFGSLN
uniref:Neurotransmitter-gated ion-channel ligand-binding domain-containing protein n=1 Tax=Plectus sambesii TaxID=2011161 RepID=A0A914XIR6_9BILA